MFWFFPWTTIVDVVKSDVKFGDSLITACYWMQWSAYFRVSHPRQRGWQQTKTFPPWGRGRRAILPSSAPACLGGDPASWRSLRCAFCVRRKNHLLEEGRWEPTGIKCTSTLMLPGEKKHTLGIFLTEETYRASSTKRSNLNKMTIIKKGEMRQGLTINNGVYGKWSIVIRICMHTTTYPLCPHCSGALFKLGGREGCQMWINNLVTQIVT